MYDKAKKHLACFLFLHLRFPKGRSIVTCCVRVILKEKNTPKGN
ncbi:hypothetical protein RV02_GL000825 [Enterococcus gilvus]|nr:hypothetical protein RV02_GL000825 [Enterococcus gilvus]